MLTGLDVIDSATALLETRVFGCEIRAYEQIGSTNTAAIEWAASGAPEGSVVFTEHQTAGRGRMGRPWQAAAGLNLTFSIILRPDFLPEQWGLITLAAGVAVAQAIEHAEPALRPMIKWPNDVLLGGRKCCGMLLESVPSADKAPLGTRAVILGIGLNVNQVDFEPELAKRATSLLLETGRHVNRSMLLAELISQLERRYADLNEGRAESIREAYLALLAGLHRRARYRLADGHSEVEGTVVGITETGALRLQTEGGVQIFHAGELTAHSIAEDFSTTSPTS